MPGPIFAELALNKLAKQATSPDFLQSSSLGYLLSVALIAVVIIGFFFGLGFSLLFSEQSNAGTRDHGIGVTFPDPFAPLHPSSSPHPSPEDGGSPSLAPAPPPGVSLAQGSQRGELVTEDTSPVSDAVPSASEDPMPPASEIVVDTASDAVSNSPPAPITSTVSKAILAGPGVMSPVEPESNAGVPTALAVPPTSPRLAGADVTDLLARGDSFLFIGDLKSARLFYERAATAGDGRAALRMGATFDPAFLRSARLPRSFRNPARALTWYHRAFESKAERQEDGPDTK